MVESRRLDIPDLVLLTPRKFGDARGFLSETYSQRAWAEAGISQAFVQENHSFSSTKGTVRGLHLQAPPAPQGKLVRCLRGAILDVAVDVRVGSPSYGKHMAVELSEENWQQFFIPEGFAHGFCTLTPDAHVLYKLTDFYEPRCEIGVRWDDPALDIEWPDFAGSVASDRDKALPLLSLFESPFRYGG